MLQHDNIYLCMLHLSGTKKVKIKKRVKPAHATPATQSGFKGITHRVFPGLSAQ